MSTLADTARRNGYPDPADNDHTCPGCGAPIACEWKTIAETRRRAAYLVLQARHLEAKLHGEPLGRKRTRDFTPEEARDLVRDLGSFNAAAAKLGVTHQTVTRALKPLGLTPNPKYRRKEKA